MPRAFLAVRIPPTEGVRLLLRDLGRLGRAVRPVDPANLHITLRFLGNTDQSMFDGLREALEVATGGVGAFPLSLGGMGAFPRPQRPSIIWAGTGGNPHLAAIERGLEPLLDTLGWGAETRPFQGHVTLARVKARPPEQLQDLLRAHAETPLGTVAIESVDLMLSDLRAEGPSYRVAASVQLES